MDSGYTRRRAFCGLFFLLTASMLSAAAAPNPQEIVRKSVEVIHADWEQAAKYSYLERDVESKRHSTPNAKTYRVLTIDGSPYNLVTSINDQPLPAAEQAAEERKLRREIERRQAESERERKKRISRFHREQMRDRELLTAMVDAFQFQLAGNAPVDGHMCWILDAKPKPGYQPTKREEKVLKGMKGRLWIDQRSYQWVKVQAEVVKPVTFYGFFARVGPGTQFELEQEPVTDNLWLAKRFSVKVKASTLGFNEDSTQDETYRDYQPMPQASAVLQSIK
jgi:hypothetical protein